MQYFFILSEACNDIYIFFLWEFSSPCSLVLYRCCFPDLFQFSLPHDLGLSGQIQGGGVVLGVRTVQPVDTEIHCGAICENLGFF